MASGAKGKGHDWKIKKQREANGHHVSPPRRPHGGFKFARLEEELVTRRAEPQWARAARQEMRGQP